MNLPWRQLPGGELIEQGLNDVAHKRTTIPACLIVIAFPKLSQAGLLPVDTALPFTEGELTLYSLLRKEGGNAFSKYNALLRQLVSFEHCLARSVQRSP